MEGCTNREGIFWKGLGRGRGSEGDDGNMAEPGRHLARKALRRRKPQAAGVNARPTLWLGMGGDTEAAANRQGRRRADVSIGPYAGGAPGGKESLRDSSEPFGRPIPTCGSGSEFDRETG